MLKRMFFGLALLFGILGYSQAAFADTYAVILNQTNAPVDWQNSRFQGKIAPNGYFCLSG